MSDDSVTLLDMCDAGGCGSKLALAELEPILEQLAVSRTAARDGQIMDDFGDAAVQSCPGSDMCLITTIDFGTPVSDDPFTWGYISAQNAMSDVYAVGGTPSTALSVLGWPAGKVPELGLPRVFAGAIAAVTAASATIVGGHSLRSIVPFFGLSVTGFARQGDLRGNASGQPGTILCLTKRIGSGLAIAGRKTRTLGEDGWAEAEALMKQSNAAASEAARLAGIKASTDVTGFGVLGHAHMMGRRSGVAVELWPDAVPLISAAREVLARGVVPRSAERLIADAHTFTDIDSVPVPSRVVLCDPQTSGGLMLAATAEQMRALESRGLEFWPIGRLMVGTPGVVTFAQSPSRPPRA
jgi:selenide, water dikinase